MPFKKDPYNVNTVDDIGSYNDFDFKCSGDI